MPRSSKSQSGGPVLPLNFSFHRSLSPSGQFSSPASDLLSPSSSTLQSSFAASIFQRPSSPTRVNLYTTTPPTQSVRISINRSLSPSRSAVSVRDQVVAKKSSITKKTFDFLFAEPIEPSSVGYDEFAGEDWDCGGHSQAGCLLCLKPVTMMFEIFLQYAESVGVSLIFINCPFAVVGCLASFDSSTYQVCRKSIMELVVLR
ncbi:hypothetical protein Ancab_001735 [Ancistrocladus abbreviatus]